jgi:hypothetical protein
MALKFLGRSSYDKGGGLAVTSSTLTRRFGRLSISALPLAMLLTMASTVTNGQAIDKDTSVKPQPNANAPAPPAGNDGSSQKTTATTPTKDKRKGPKSSVRAGKDPTKFAGAVAIEAKSGSFRLDTGSQGKRSYHLKTPYGTLNVTD